jgi:two-component sensor histidine kinase
METDYSLLENVPVGIFILDADWVVRFWNACMSSWTGIAASTILARPISDFFPRLAEPRYRSRIDPILGGGPPVILSYQLHGDLFPSRAPTSIAKVRHTTITRISSDGLPLLLFAVEDRTEAANRLREARIEIGLRQQTEVELRKAVAYKDMLVKEISHRVKNNLVLIQGLIALEAEESQVDGDERTLDRLSDLQGRIASIATLHDRLYQSGDSEGVSLDDYFRSLGATIFETFLPRNSEARLELSIEPSSLPVDATLKLGLIATELLTNSIKYALRGRTDGRVSLSIKRPGGGVLLEVSDDGPGLPALGSTSGGLGTRIVAILAEEFCGELRIEAGKGGGTKVLIPADSPLLREAERGQAESTCP